MLPVIGAECADRVERFADLLDRLLDRDSFGQAVGSDFHAGAADVVAELDEGFRLLDRFCEYLRIGTVEKLEELFAG